MVANWIIPERINLVNQAYKRMASQNLPPLINEADDSSLFFRGMNLGQLMLIIAQGAYILNIGGNPMHVETNRTNALPYAIDDSKMYPEKRRVLLQRLARLGIETQILGPGILLGLKEPSYLHPSMGDHGYTIRTPYPMKAIDNNSRKILLEITGIDVYNLP